ncbi:HTH-type transcriptional activator RhaR [Flavobacterium bizetiae]|uniref:HTH-type transcriptional activator RhaR n=1 Tax=Flavobacterium bizetiae TaxID=2704140 RepID=A0A6J4GP93_9FLAO|nr:helix-turn-helix domain-containing protein [Flavobacterium bizetiae]CAA9200711.1 HTH-type transcriptional activator RhaR [Flavobacterium bizetiae]CAD5342018.1 HTH-type transcriptional activator RhaR [Flavobacterium bizetiae]CAD5348284.1 HTH-type transcriptional activator RhaR [Flavobacterium bizetiae]
MKSKTNEKVKTYSPQGFREKFLGEDNPIHLLFKSNSDHFFCLEIGEMMQMQYPVPPSKHSCHTLIFVSSGQHVMKLGYQEYTTTDNEIIMVPAGQIFSLDNINNIHKGFICQFHPDILIRKYGSREMLNEFDFMKISGNPKITLDQKDVPDITAILNRLQKEYSETSNANLNIVQSYLITLFYEMNKNSVKSSKSISAAEVIANKFKELIYTNIKTHHQVNYYASLLNVTPNHLNKSVKTVTGKSAAKWIEETILLEAKYLLYQTTLSVSEIAMQVGHEDHSYFSRFFKKHESITPVQYRKLIDKS